jgi:methyl-accepting chemotaxis protein
VAFWASSKPKDDEKVLGDLALLQMVERTQAVIHFKTDGTVIMANGNFLKALGYEAEEVVGKNHSMFVYPSYVKTNDYREFWEKLRAGESFTSQFPRLRKDGRKIWIQATYAPITDEQGNVVRVTKIAMDVTVRRTALESITKGMEALTDGDLSYRVGPCSIPDLANLGNAYNTSVEHLSEMISDLQAVAETIDAVSSQIGSTSDELSRRTETQAATLEQTAAAIEELNSNSRSAVSHAQEVGEEANATRTSAEGSQHLVQDVTDAMKRIEGSSDAIARIISVIDDIAFQTNLLALNAGVEAARAGEAGLGFAVVASEVRSLAGRTADSAREIKGLIEQSAGHVKTGVDLVDRTGTQLTAIFEGVGRISERVKEVAYGLGEQSTTLGEINSAISQLDQVTQRNAAMVVDTADATKGLSEKSAALRQSIGVFRTSNSGGSSSWSDTGSDRGGYSRSA